MRGCDVKVGGLGLAGLLGENFRGAPSLEPRFVVA